MCVIQYMAPANVASFVQRKGRGGRQVAMTDHNLEKSENKASICLITSVCGYTLLVFKDCHGYQVDAIAPNGDRYCNGEIFYSALCAETKGRKWIEDLREEDLDLELGPDE